MTTTLRTRLRRLANRVLAPAGIEVLSTQTARRQFAESQLGRLLPAMRHFGIDLVVDVGANVGQFALELIEHGYAGRIVSVEPLPQAHASLQAAAAPFPRWTVLQPMALGADEGMVEFQVAGNSVSSSVLAMLERHVQAAPGSAPVGTLQVRQTTLDRALGGTLAGARALLKIDVQGYERQVLAGATQALQQAPLVLLEMSVVPLYRGQWLADEVLAHMHGQGFVPWFQHPDFTEAGTGRVLQYNALFARG